MQLETLRFGRIHIAKDRVIRFAQGIPGFEQYHEYTLIQPDEDLPFSYLQCVNDGHLSFIVIDPFLVKPDYEFELNESVKKELLITKQEQVSVLAIMTVKDDIKKATLNLKAPLVINVQQRLGKQLILHDYDYSTKHPLFAEVPAGQADQKGV